MIVQFLLALQFLTIIPVRIRGTVHDSELPKSMRWYPLIGVLLGAASAGVYWVGLRLFSPGVAIVSAVVSLILLSGALHLDGWADMCDGFYGHRDRKQILAIMRDSHSGAMAIIGIFCLLSMKIALLSSIDPARIWLVLILPPVLGRWSMVWLCAKSTYARPEGGKGSAYIGQVDSQTLLIATLSAMATAWFILRMKGLLLMLIVALFAQTFRWVTEKRIGGMTGDTLGACNELAEVVVLAAFCAHTSGIGL